MHAEMWRTRGGAVAARGRERPRTQDAGGSIILRTAMIRYAPLAVGLKPSAKQGESHLRGRFQTNPHPCLSVISVPIRIPALRGEARLRGLYRIISSKTIFICRWATGRMPVSIMIPSLLCRVVSLRANETPAPPGFLLCGRDARTPRVPLMRTRRPHLPGFLLCGRDARAPRVPLMRTRRPHLPGCLLCGRDARTSQGSSYANETPAHPGSAGTRSVPEHRDAEDAETITICIHPFNA